MIRLTIALTAGLAVGATAWPRAAVGGSDGVSFPAVAPYQEPAAQQADLVGGLDVTCRSTRDKCPDGKVYSNAELALRVGISDEFYGLVTQIADIGRTVNGMKATGLEDLSIAAGWLEHDRPLRLGFEVGTTLPTGVRPLSRTDNLISVSTVGAQCRGPWWIWLQPSIDASTSVQALHVRAGFSYTWQASKRFFVAEANASQEYGMTPDLDLGGRVLLALPFGSFIIGLRAEYADATIVGLVIGVRTDWRAGSTR